MKIFREGNSEHFICVLTDDLCIYIGYGSDPYNGESPESRRASMRMDADALIKSKVWGEPIWEESR